MKEFKDILRAKRKACGLKQYEVYKQVGVSDTTYSRWENGVCYPSIFNIIELARVFGCTTDELLLGGET